MNLRDKVADWWGRKFGYPLVIPEEKMFEIAVESGLEYGLLVWAFRQNSPRVQWEKVQAHEDFMRHKAEFNALWSEATKQ